MKKKVKPFTDNRVYSDFKGQLNAALEKVLHNHLSACDQIMKKLEDKVILFCGHEHYINQFRLHGAGPIHTEIVFASYQTAEIARRMRAMTFLLAHAGETEAMARALEKPLRSNAKVKARQDKEMPSGGSVQERIELYFNRLARDIQDALQLGYVLKEKPTELKKRVLKAFPTTRKITKTPALTKRKLKEADSFEDEELIPSVSTGISDDDMWEEILEQYKSEHLPRSVIQRTPDDKTFFYDVDINGSDERYTWEVEQEITEDFVHEVRAGTQDAAKENGVEDFMWIAVIDAKTDECCLVRDGKSSAQIESEIADGTIDGEECDAIVAPAHFNCRCDSAPMTTDLPEGEERNYGDFDQWLDEKAAE